MEREFACIHAVLALRPSPFEAENGGYGKSIGLVIDGRIRPDLEMEMSGGVRESEFEIWLVRLGLADGAGLELRVNGGDDRGLARLFPKFGDGDRAHAPHPERPRRDRHAWRQPPAISLTRGGLLKTFPFFGLPPARAAPSFRLPRFSNHLTRCPSTTVSNPAPPSAASVPFSSVSSASNCSNHAANGKPAALPSACRRPNKRVNPLFGFSFPTRGARRVSRLLYFHPSP